MPGTDSDIDLNNINKPIYKEQIADESDSNNIKNCILKQDKYMIRNSNNEIDYKKYFKIRLKGDIIDTSTELNLNSSYDISAAYIRLNNVDDTKEPLKTEWKEASRNEKILFIDSIIASVILTHKYKEWKKHSLIECNNILDEINGCYCIFPFIEIADESDTETVYNITLPARLKLLNPDKVGITDNDSIIDMFDDDKTEDKKDFITKLPIKINDNITYEDLKMQISATPFIKDCINVSSLTGVNFIDGINNIIDHEIYKEFINTINHENARTGAFDNFIETKKSDGTLRDHQFKQDKNSMSSNYDELLNPLYIVPKANMTEIRKLRKEMQNFIQKKINALYKNVPKTNDTKTKFTYKKMIINSIYFDKDTYRSSETDGDQDDVIDEHGILLEKDPAIDLYTKINNDEFVVKLKHATGDTMDYYHFLIDVEIPICNTSPIRKNITDVLLNNNLIVIIISYLVAILIHAFISCCLEFWLKYGNGVECIYVTNTCKNIGDNNKVNISLIDYFFRYRLTNFPYQRCQRAITQSGGNTNVRTLVYPILSNDDKTICIREDAWTTHNNDRPFPYNIIDYGEKNFDSESIKYFFRTIVILILCLLIPLRYIFNKCIGSLSTIYNKYISRSNFLSSIIFVLLPLSIPLISILILVSLACSIILYITYSIITIIHYMYIFIVPIKNSKGIRDGILCLLGTVCAWTTFILIAISIIQPRHPDGRVIFEGFHKLNTLEKFFILVLLILSGIIIFSVKSLYTPGSGSVDDEITANTEMAKWYKLILYPFDYTNLTKEQKQEFDNYRINKEVNREGNGKYSPLKKFLTSESSTISILTILVALFILTMLFMLVETTGKKKEFSIIIAILLSFITYIKLNNYLYSYLIYCRDSTFKESIVFKGFLEWIAPELAVRFQFIMRLLSLIVFGPLGFMAYRPSRISQNIKEFEPVQTNELNNRINTLNVFSLDFIDLSEFILLFKKLLYLTCVCFVLFLTGFVLPVVMLITLLFIVLRLLYIFLIVPFTKGGHFIFRIMRNRYKILTYMLCTAVIINISDKQIFGENTTTVVSTMSAILALIIIYNLVND
tara:strand:- start:1643 stop:4861 length:3219 start_codon:yes stop_codon:yes gene_type:complete